MAIDLKPNQEKTNFISAIYKLTILTEGYVHFLIMKKNKEKTVSNLGTGFGTEHVFFSHCDIAPYMLTLWVQHVLKTS